MYKNFGKRFFDIIFSLLALSVIFPVIVIAWLIASIETKSNGFFAHARVGREGKVFYLIKIKTMKNDLTGSRSSITALSNSEITVSGRVLRKYKLDELPQLINVLIGHMSFVGPRPDVPGFADALIGGARTMLSVRPGITGPASIKYRNEDELLSKVDNPLRYSNDVIWPDKVSINVKYVEDLSFIKDIYYILKTVRLLN